MRTPLTRSGIVAELGDAYAAEFGVAPAPMQLAILGAHVGLETGNGKHLWNWNFGNIRGSYNGQTTSLEHATEIIDGREVSVPAGFRAYPTARDGARDFLRFLGVDTTPNNGRPNRYQAAWDAALAGDVTTYVRALKQAGYFTADEGKYRRGVAALVESYLPIAMDYLGVVDPAPDTERPPPDNALALSAVAKVEAALAELKDVLRGQA